MERNVTVMHLRGAKDAPDIYACRHTGAKDYGTSFPICKGDHTEI